MRYRDPNTRCMVCGGQMPREVRLEQSGDYYRYVCPDCGTTILEGIVSTNGEPADSPEAPPRTSGANHIRHDVDWKTWEVWWTNRLVLTMMHGVAVAGEEQMKDFVDDIREKHDDNS